MYLFVLFIIFLVLEIIEIYVIFIYSINFVYKYDVWFMVFGKCKYFFD